MNIRVRTLTFLAVTMITASIFLSACATSGSSHSGKGSASASVGDVVTFGNFKWYVIEKSDEGYTLLCKRPVTTMAYNSGTKTTTWEECDLRKWLNNDFYNEFRDDEKAVITRTHVRNADNAKYGTDAGNDTDDYVYLLSEDEANGLKKSIRKCDPWWWLRSPGNCQGYAVYVGSRNKPDPFGDFVENVYGGVRPVIKITASGSALFTGRSDTPQTITADNAADVSVGDVVSFGKYTWYVIKKSDDYCTLLCEKPVTTMSYCKEEKNITWEDCDVRKWLNNDFYNEFSDDEKAMMTLRHNRNTSNGDYGTDCGNDTDDYIYLPDLDEAASLLNDKRNCGTWWWLRSCGITQTRAAIIHDFDGYAEIGYTGYKVDRVGGVRPVVNIKY